MIGHVELNVLIQTLIAAERGSFHKAGAFPPPRSAAASGVETRPIPGLGFASAPGHQNGCSCQRRAESEFADLLLLDSRKSARGFVVR
jgi:hypothetical protein